MKLGIVSDVHSNLPALKKVFEHMDRENPVDVKVCLGDLVGYNPFPNECVELIVQECNYIVMGNHDAAVFSQEELDAMNPLAKKQAIWTRENLTAANKSFIKDLEYGYVLEDSILLIHGSPRAPFAYADNETEALNGFYNPVRDFNIAFVGHTHVPCVWQLDQKGHLAYIRPTIDTSHIDVNEWEFKLDEGCRYIINGGATGQPRDNDPRASYVVYDTETRVVTFYKVPYSIDRTIGRMQQYGFETNLILRLLNGQ